MTTSRVGRPQIFEPEKICLEYGMSTARMVKNGPYNGVWGGSNVYMEQIHAL